MTQTQTLQQRFIANELEASHLKSEQIEQGIVGVLEKAQVEVKDYNEHKKLYDSNFYKKLSKSEQDIGNRIRNLPSAGGGSVGHKVTRNAGLREAVNAQKDSRLYQKEIV